MSLAQRAVRVFLSSTFRDFTKERDLLVKQVFPTLRARLAERFVDLVDVDLRWGITEQEAERGEVLPICLAEIDRSRPFFVGLLGERYGWVPPSETYPAEILEKHPWLKEHQGGKSVTELEILHGVLNNPGMAGRALFYFRSPDYSRNQDSDYLPMSGEDLAKQDALKASIRNSGFPVIENYETPQAAANQIQEDLWAALDVEFPATDVPDAFMRDFLQHEAYAAPRRRIYVGGAQYLERLDEVLNNQAQWVMLEGASGSGKSALLANWIDRLTNQDDLIVHAHFIGANPSAGDPVALIRRLIERIRRETGTKDEAESDPDALLDALPEWLGLASAWAEHNNKRFLFALDSLNGLTERRELLWFPKRLPPRIHLVVSTLPGEIRERLIKKAEWLQIKVKPLDDRTARQVFTAYLALYNKTLPGPLIEQVMTHPLVNNPLFLLTLAEELRLFGEHERLSEQISYYQESKTVDDLFERVLARIEADHGAAIVRQIMTALWAARSGLREDELLAYTGIPLLKWSPIRHALGPALLENGGRYVFSHDYLSIAVSDRYMAGNNCLGDEGQSEEALTLRREAHIRIAEWFEANAFHDDDTVTNARAAEEIPYQWLKAAQWERLCKSLTNMKLFQAHTKVRDKGELLGYWLDAETNLNLRLENAYEQAWDRWDLDTSLELTGDLAAKVANILSYAGRYSDFAVTLCRIALEINERALGPEHLSTCVSINNLARLLHDRGDLDAAEPLFRRALEINECSLGPEHFWTGASINNLASLLQDRGDLDAAEPLFRRALEINERALGPEHPGTSIFIQNLARLLKARGDLDAAEPLFRRALEIDERALGPEHPDTGGSIHNLARLLRDRGDLNAAEPLFRRALEIRERALGPEHPDTAVSINSLAHLLNDRGDLDAAEPLFRRALEINERALGPEHTDTAVSINSLALLLKARGDLDAAEPLFRRALEINERALGPEHTDTGGIIHNLASLLKAGGDLDAAEPLFRRALEINERALGPEHPRTGVSFHNLALLLQARGDLDAAEPLLQRALEIRERALGPEHPDTAVSINSLALLLQERGDLDAAEPLFQRALEIRERALGPEHPQTGVIVKTLADLLLKCGDLDAAELLFRRALEIDERALGPEHPDTGVSINNHAYLLFKIGDLDAAEPLFRRALEINERELGPEHPDTCLTIYALARLLEDRGDLDAAEPFFRRALEIDERELGPEHIATDIHNYGELLRELGRYEEALQCLLRALKINERNVGRESEEAAIGLNALGKVYELRGDYEESRDAYSRSIVIRESLFGADHPKTASLYFRLGELELACGNKKSAKVAFGKALKAYEIAFGSDDEDTKAARLAFEGC